ncbi:MAG: arginine--tRNA ligase [Phycisphaeraceae bacterium]|nr:arginine--tRNA ligase [Phycisphaeraceae bacterium]
MQHPEQILDERFRAALISAFGDACADTDPLIRPAANPDFGDYQANVAMGLAGTLKQAPRQIAEKIVETVDLDDLGGEMDVAGPGFINITLGTGTLAEAVKGLGGDLDAALKASGESQTVVLDYSGPNVAKEMHVGHLRSTVIGDSIGRVLEAIGHTVIRQNHLGDWGTQFGMLTEYLLEEGLADGDVEIPDLNALYQAAKRKFDADEDFARRSRERVVALQAGDEATLKLWQTLIDVSRDHFNAVYQRLDVRLSDDDVRGESFYNDRLKPVVDGLEEAGLLEESRGAAVVFPEGFEDREGEPLPMIVRKSDGGYLYATTDLAAARFRIDELDADRLIYVTDARQGQHFQMVFKTLRDAGWADAGVRLDHVPFGTVLGEDRKPFKTRSGEVVKLVDLLDEAERRAEEILQEKGTDLDDEEREQVAHAVGIGALKYADLSSDRIKDYVFDWSRMLAFDGNTAPYLQNAVVRIHAIFRKAERSMDSVDPVALSINQPAERQLALAVLQFGPTVRALAETLEPHRLCTCLYEIAGAYHQFYEKCPVIKAESDEIRESRLALSALVAEVLECGLDLLGIETVSRM